MNLGLTEGQRARVRQLYEDAKGRRLYSAGILCYSDHMRTCKCLKSRRRPERRGLGSLHAHRTETSVPGLAPLRARAARLLRCLQLLAYSTRNFYCRPATCFPTDPRSTPAIHVSSRTSRHLHDGE